MIRIPEFGEKAKTGEVDLAQGPLLLEGAEETAQRSYDDKELGREGQRMIVAVFFVSRHDADGLKEVLDQLVVDEGDQVGVDDHSGGVSELRGQIVGGRAFFELRDELAELLAAISFLLGELTCERVCFVLIKLEEMRKSEHIAQILR